MPDNHQRFEKNNQKSLENKQVYWRKMRIFAKYLIWIFLFLVYFQI
jgi:hypothetical protein